MPGAGLTIGLRAAARCLLLGLALSPAGTAAQGVTTSGVSGRVVDAEGGPVAGARIELRRDGTGALHATVTDAEGRFQLAGVRPGGPYTLEASRIGLRTVTRGGLVLNIGRRLALEIEMRATALPLPEISVRVESDPDFDPARMGPATVVDRQTLEELPTLTRDFTDFAQLSPLVVVDAEGVSVAGSNVRFNNIQIDGALNQDLFGLSPSGVAGGRARGRVIPLSAIEELQVLVAPYDVRQSGFTGGVLNAVTRSGTNRFRASAFGFFRDDAFVGDAVIAGTPRSPGDLDNVFVGFDAGGPIVRDRLHLFVAGELESRRKAPDGFLVGVDDPVLSRLSPDSVARFTDILADFGADAGEAGTFTLENDLANVFARLDLQLDEGSSAMVRYAFAGAEDDPAPNRLPGDAYELSSNGTGIESRNHSLVGQWLARLGPDLSNELLVSAQFLRDRESPRASYPRVDVLMSARLGESGFTRELRAGSSFFGSESELDQDVLQISNALTLATGDHTLTGGVGLERFSIRRSYLPGSRGAFEFASLADLEANAPTRYVANVPLDADAGRADFSVNQLFGFVQEELRVSGAIRLQLGLRVDVPTLADEPAANPLVAESFGLATSDLPGGKILLSPRLGFNVRTGGELETQIRGGAGLFTGRPLFAWLAEAFQNTGLSSGFLTCERRNVGVPDPEVVPAFDPTAPPPTSCADGSGQTSAVPTVTVFDPDFRFPQSFRISAALDQRLPAGFVLSLEGVYTKAVNQIFLEELNLGPAIPAGDRVSENGYTNGFGFGTRESFGDPGAGNEQFDPPPGDPPAEREAIFLPRRVDDTFGQVIRVTNRSESFSYALSARLRKRFGERLAVDAGYAFNRSADLQSLAFLDAAANVGSTAIEGDPTDPKRQPSLFDRPHKVVASATASWPNAWGETRLSLLYVGQSGRPYSYVYADDVNADGYPGIGQALDLANDLVFVPEGPFDFPTGRSAVSGLLFEQLVLREPCLRENRLRVLSRNACRTPWTHQLDLRISQAFDLGGLDVDVMLDVLNVLNLIDRDLGQVRTVNPAVRILRVPGRFDDDAVFGSGLPEPDDPLEARFAGPLARGEGGGVRALLPTVPEIGASQWQAQLGIRLRFH